MSYADPETDLSPTDIDAAGVDVTLSIPDFGVGMEAQCMFGATYIAPTDAQYLHYQLKDGGGGSHHKVGWVGAGTTYSECIDRVVVDSNLQIHVEFDVNGNSRAFVETLGWFFPIGM